MMPLASILWEDDAAGGSSDFIQSRHRERGSSLVCVGEGLSSIIISTHVFYTKVIVIQ